MKPSFLTSLVLAATTIAAFNEIGVQPKVSYTELPDNPFDYFSLDGTIVCNCIEGGKRLNPIKIFSNQRDLVDDYAKNVLSLKGEQELIWMPIYKFEHSGVTFATDPFSSKWDSGFVGFIYMTKAEVKESHGWKALSSKRIKKIQDELTHNISLYSNYANGDVFDISFELIEQDDHDDDMPIDREVANDHLRGRTIIKEYGFENLNNLAMDELPFVSELMDELMKPA